MKAFERNDSHNTLSFLYFTLSGEEDFVDFL